MTAIAEDRSGLTVNEEAVERLEEIADYNSTKERKNRFSGRTEHRTTYYMDGLDLCTIVKVQDKIVEIQSGLIAHPVLSEIVC